MRSMRNWITAAAVICLMAGSLAAQDITKGSIAGVVRDPTGAVVPNATVKLESPNGNRETKTGSAGDYMFSSLVPGPGYVVSVNQPGFSAARLPNLTVSINQRTTADITLSVGTAATTVEVTSGAVETIDTTSTTVGANIPESVYQNVPIGRNISSVIAMAPGVSDSLGAGVANPSINGASGLENMYVINGANVTDPGFGGFGTQSRVFGSLGNGVNFDFVQEVQVKSGGFEAQYGQSLGGVVNVITKSGTNQYHGDIYAYFQPHRFEATRPNVNDVTVNKTTYIAGAGSYDFGFDFGGYIKKDKLFWYAGYNPQFAMSYRSADKSYANSRLGEISVRTTTNNYNAKLNWNLSANHQLEGSVFGDPASTPITFYRNTSLSANDDLRESAVDYGSRTWTGRYNGALTRSWVVSSNFSNFYNHFDESPKYNGYQIQDTTRVQEGTGGQVIYNGLGYLENTESRVNSYNITSSHTFNGLGTHTIDYGYQFENVDYALNRRYTGPDFQIPNLPQFKDGAGKIQHGASLVREHAVGTCKSSDFACRVQNPIVLRVTRGDYSTDVVATNTRYHAAFAQDAWQMTRFFSIKAGLRWEQQAMRGDYSRYVFGGNWAPRLGLIVDPSGNRKTKIFADWGRFFEKVPLDIAVRNFSLESSFRGALYKDPGPTGTPDLSPANYLPGLGQTLSQTGGPDALPAVLGGTKTQYQDEVVAGYEHEFAGGMTFSGRFVYRHLMRVLEDISGINVTQNNAGVSVPSYIANPSGSFDRFINGVPCTSGPNCDPSTGFNKTAGNLGSDGQPDGFPNPTRIYKAMELSLTKRFSANWQFYGTYRLSKLYGNYEGNFRNDNGQTDPNISSMFDFTNSDGLLGDQFAPGVLPSDRRHQIKLFSNYQWKALNFGLAWKIESGTPISELDAHPAYDNAGEVPIGGRGKLGRTPWDFPFDAKVEYLVKMGENKRLKFGADLFNLFNSTRVFRVDQWAQLNGGVKNPDFLKPDNQNFSYPYLVPFHARLSARFEF